MARGLTRLRLPAVLALPLGLVAAYGAYELILLATSWVLASGPGAFDPAVVGRLFAINAAAFGVLLCADRLIGRRCGAAPTMRRISQGSAPRG